MVIKYATSPIIVISDADMIPDKDFVNSHFIAQKNSLSFTCFEGLAYDLHDLSWPPRIKAPQIGRVYKPYYRLGWYYFLTGNLSFPKKLIEEMGGFDESFTGYGWEDLELGYRLHQKKIPLKFLPTAINYHYHVVDDQAYQERNIQKGLSAQHLIQKHPALKTFVGDHVLSRFLFYLVPFEGKLYRVIKNLNLKTKNKFVYNVTNFFLKEHFYWQGLFRKISLDPFIPQFKK
jgi:hypothetical protein